MTLTGTVERVRRGTFAVILAAFSRAPLAMQAA